MDYEPILVCDDSSIVNPRSGRPEIGGSDAGQSLRRRGGASWSTLLQHGRASVYSTRLGGRTGEETCAIRKLSLTGGARQAWALCHGNPAQRCDLTVLDRVPANIAGFASSRPMSPTMIR